MNADAQKRAAAARAVEFVRPGMRLGPWHRLDREAFRRTGRRARPRTASTSSRCRPRRRRAPTPNAAAFALTTLDETPRTRPDRRRRRRNRARSEPDQGRRRRAAAGKDRRGSLRAHDRDRRSEQMGRHARPLSAADRGDPVRLCGDTAGGRKGDCRPPAPRAADRCGRVKTAMLSSRMAGTGSLMRRSGGLTIQRPWRMRFPVYPGSWSMACLSVSRGPPYWPDRTV